LTGSFLQVAYARGYINHSAIEAFEVKEHVLASAFTGMEHIFAIELSVDLPGF
jgi:hypothetical protein